MTKMKNTKKGMAKKALSISLVAAMLATSNVPVWAAFEADDATPIVVEEPVAEVPQVEAPSEEIISDEAETYDVNVENGDIDVSGVTFDTKEVTWSLGGVNIGGTIKDTANNTLMTVGNYGWRIKGAKEDFKTGTISGNSLSGLSLSASDISAHEEIAGQTIELHVYLESAVHNFDVVVGEVAVKKCSINDAEIRLTQSYDKFVYNGKEYLYNTTDEEKNKVEIAGLHVAWDSSSNNVSAGWNWGDIQKYFIATAAAGAVNADDDFTVTVTAKSVLDDGSNNPYIGSTNITKTVQKKNYAAGDLIAKYAKDTTYEYTGKAIEPELSKTTLAESVYNKTTNPTGLGGVDYSSAITKVETWTTDNTNVGKKNVAVYWDSEKLTNFTSSTLPTCIDIINAFEIVKRNLDKCTATVGTVPTGSLVDDVVTAGLVNIYDSNGNLLNLTSSDYELIVMDPEDQNVRLSKIDKAGKYQGYIIAKGNNTEGKILNVSFEADAMVPSVDMDKMTSVSKEYTSSEIKPTKADFGNELHIKVFSNQPTSGYTYYAYQPNEWEIVGYSSDITNVVGTHYVIAKVNTGILTGKTFNIPFTITPLKVTAADIDVEDYVIYDRTIKNAADYNVDVTVVAKSATGASTKITLDAADFAASYKFINKNAPDNTIETTVKILNKNYIYNATDTVVATEHTKIKTAVLQDSFIKISPISYVYTGGKIRPEFTVYDGDKILEEGTDYEVEDVSLAVNAGTATLVINGLGLYKDSTAKATYEITPASIEDVTINVGTATYTGKQIRPTVNGTPSVKILLGDNDVTSQFDVTSYGENINAGKDAGSVTIALVKGNKNFTGTSKSATFDIKKATVIGSLKVVDNHGKNVTSNLNSNPDYFGFKYDETAKELPIVEFVPNGVFASEIKPDDYEIKYVNNIYGDESGYATVYVAFKEDSNFIGDTTAVAIKDYVNDTTVKDYAASMKFTIGSLQFDGTNVTVKNGVYAGGLPVKPEILVQFGGKTLVEGKDYKVTTTPTVATEVTLTAVYEVKIEGINGYKGSLASSTSWNAKEKISKWGIDKFNFADADIKATADSVVVKNGSVIVPASEYTITYNENDTVTIAATANNKNYIGSQTIAIEKEDTFASPVITASVDRNMVNVSITGTVDSATAYDYVLCQSAADLEEEIYFKSKMSVDATTTQFQFVREGQYYVYARAAKRDDNGKKIVSDWSVAAVINVTCDTPNAPTVTKVTTSGNTVTVTYTTGARTEGVDVMLGGAVRKQLEDDAMRPVNYNSKTGLIKNVPATTKTVTFTNVAKGTYFVGVHPYITSNDGLKYFGRWSKQTGITKVVVG